MKKVIMMKIYDIFLLLTEGPFKGDVSWLALNFLKKKKKKKKTHQK
jgi:hypothetical protein